MLRIFFAVALQPSLRQSLIQQQLSLRGKLPAASWIAPQALHITLKFLGNIPDEDVESIRKAVSFELKDVGTILLSLGGVGVFPSREAPRIVWAGVASGEEKLRLLAHQLDRSLGALGYPMEERPFHPHVTLARVKRDQRSFGKALNTMGILDTNMNFGTQEVNTITLFKSDLTSSGSVYTVLWEVGI